MAEVHDDSDVGTGKAVGEELCTLSVPAQPVVVQGFGPQLHAELRRAPIGTEQLGGHEVQVLIQAPQRLVIDSPARQDQRPRAGLGGQGEQHLEVPFARFLSAGVERCVQVADVAVH